MSDRFFYPFMTLLVALIVGVALNAGGGNKAPRLTTDYIVQNGYEVSGESLRTLVASPGTTLSFTQSAEVSTQSAVLAAHMTREAAPPSAGVFAQLGPDYEAAFGGKTIQVTIMARAASQNPSEGFLLQYYTAGAGDSPPVSFTPTQSLQEYSITFSPGEPVGDKSSDYVGIWPDTKGGNAQLEVESITVTVVDVSPG